MQSKPKVNSIITSAYDADANILTFSVLGIGDIPFDLNKVHADNLAHAAVHGFNQRIPDAAAIGLTDDDGNIIPKADRTQAKFDRMRDLVAWYESGVGGWSRKGDGGGGRSLTIEAIARVKAVDYDRAVEMVARHAETVCGGDRKKALRELAKSAKVQTAMAAIRAERTPATSVDADEALDSMK